MRRSNGNQRKEARRDAGAHFGIVRADAQLLSTLRGYGVLDAFSSDYVFSGLGAVFSAYEHTTKKNG